MATLRLPSVFVLLGGIGALAFSPSCNIETCEEGAVCDGSGSHENDEADLCGEFCSRLVTCKTIVSDDREQCESQCRTAFSDRPRATTDGISCVIQDACRESYTCPDAPLPDHAIGGSGGSSAAGGAAGSGGSVDAGSGGSTAGAGGAGGACGAAGPCSIEQDCLDGQCHERCSKSCECAEGESCTAGHCAPDVPPPPRCTVDCDCPNGQTCTSGTCA